jgi:formamidopyrimidine-DNA glycosylase
MPELPEVETTRRGIAPHIEGRMVTRALVREPRLRWPVRTDLPELLTGQVLRRVERRAKYLLFGFDSGTLLVHLGMSGSLRVLPVGTLPAAHDHVDLEFGSVCLRMRDPRRFGALLWTPQDPTRHERLRALGPEPLSETFDGAWLHRAGRLRRVAVKQLVMDGKVVAGVGNIYANEALFRARIHPGRPSNRISRARYGRLADTIKAVLTEAIAEGGTTLRDFQREDGRPGYFRIQLQAYGRGGEACLRCGRPLRELRLGQRATVYCPQCQR